jgi:Fe2+ or Zn2+ uptake regulation protein
VPQVQQVFKVLKELLVEFKVPKVYRELKELRERQVLKV